MDFFRFIHCSDLHLDSPFEGIRILNPEIGAILREATFKAFDRIIDTAIREEVDFLVIAGDVYDSADRSLRAQIRFREGLVRAADCGIWSFVAHGNHDPLSGWDAGLHMPDLVTRFGDTPQKHVYRRGGEDVAHVHGMSYPVREVRSNVVREFKKVPGAPFSIGVLHCNLGGNPDHGNYAPCTLDDLVASKMDYWALGHVHNRGIIKDEKPSVVYSGNTQGRSIRESGERGCYIVTVDASGFSNCEFVDTDFVRWVLEEVEISESASIDDLIGASHEARERARAASDQRGSVLRLRIRGRGPLHASLIRKESLIDDLIAQLREGEADRADFVWTESLELHTRPSVELDRRRAVQDFIGEFLRQAYLLRSEPDPVDAIKKMLAVRPEYRVVSSYIEELGEDELLRIIADAEALGMEVLGGEEG